MRNNTTTRLMEVTESTLIVGVDIAKKTHWARFTNYRGVEIGKATAFNNDIHGFESIVAKIRSIRNVEVGGRKMPVSKAVVAMEPTGHYWKALGSYLKGKGYLVFSVNPAHTKKAKELDDNSQTKSDKKDAMTIARLAKDGRYHIPYQPEGVYADLRILGNRRADIVKHANSVKNRITAIIDERFPEMKNVYRKPLETKSSRQILRRCPFPHLIREAGEDGVLAYIREAVKRTVGKKKVAELMREAENSVGVTTGLSAAGLVLSTLLDELDQADRQRAELERAMEEALRSTGHAELMLSIKGVGVVSAASLLGEIGDPLRFRNARQITNYAGLNLVEDSSGQSKSGTCISKRGRSRLRCLLYQMAFTMVGANADMRRLYKHYTDRKANPLKKKQALLVVSKKIVAVVHGMLKKREYYNPELLLGAAMKERMLAA